MHPLLIHPFSHCSLLSAEDWGCPGHGDRQGDTPWGAYEGLWDPER